jgi:phage terminase small subunit
MTTAAVAKQHGAGRASGSRVKAGTSNGAAKFKRTMFAEEFVANGGNATRAAIAVGYAPRSAGVTGSRLLKESNVQTAVREAEERLLEKSRLTSELVLQQLERIVFADVLYDGKGQLRPIHKLDDGTAAALASIDVDEVTIGKGPRRKAIGKTSKVRLHDKLLAIDRAMKHLGLFERDNRQRDQNLAIQVLVAAPPRVFSVRLIIASSRAST